MRRLKQSVEREVGYTIGRCPAPRRGEGPKPLLLTVVRAPASGFSVLELEILGTVYYLAKS